MFHENVSPAYLFISWQAFSTVGTPDYIAPEVLLKKGYGVECDWFVDILSRLLELHLFILFSHFEVNANDNVAILSYIQLLKLKSSKSSMF
jgi:serine/threonine protein kinase